MFAGGIIIRVLFPFVLVPLLYTEISQAHECSHAQEAVKMRRAYIAPADPKQDEYTSRAKRSGADDFTEKFTIAVYYDSSFSRALSEATQDQIKNTVIPQMVEYFESTLKVRPLSGPIFHERRCLGSYYVTGDDPPYCVTRCQSATNIMCGRAHVPMDHIQFCRQCNGRRVFSYENDCEEVGKGSAGISASFALYVTAITTGSCPRSSTSSSGTLAFAGSCMTESEFDRPVAGNINFCPYSLLKKQSDQHLLNVAKHELTHALGFSSFLFPYFRDENGAPRTPRNYYGQPLGTSTNTVKRIIYNDWMTANGHVSHPVDVLVTPKLKEEARKHFGCSTLEGLELENQGSSGAVGSHWEARVTQGEVMNARINQGSVVVLSRMTLALLEDSGWYKANYSKAEPLLWGAGAGCELAAGSCKGYMDSQKAKGKSISPFTDEDPQELGLGYRCDIHRESLGFSNIVTFYNTLPYEYQYFDNARKGGSHTYGDYCPFKQAYVDKSCKDISNQESIYTNIYAETYGPKSRCVEHGIRWQRQVGTTISWRYGIQSGCYEYKCSNGQVTIYILGQAYPCSIAGQELSVSQSTPEGVKFTGSIICPSCLDICYDDLDNCPEAANLFSAPATAQFIPIMPANIPVHYSRKGKKKSHFKKISMPLES